MNLLRLIIFLVIPLNFLFACSSDNDNSSSNSEVWLATLYGSDSYIVIRSGDLLNYVYFNSIGLECFMAAKSEIISQTNDAYTIRGPEGITYVLNIENNGNTLVKSNEWGRFEFHKVSTTESEIGPKCNNPNSEGSVSVSMTLQDLPSSIEVLSTYTYYWDVTFDMDNNMSISSGDLIFRSRISATIPPSNSPIALDEIHASLQIVTYADANSVQSTYIKDIVLSITGNTITMSSPKSNFTQLESISNQTQINAAAIHRRYSNDIYSDYMPAEGQFTAVMDTSNVEDPINDMTGTELLVDIVSVSVNVD